MQSQILYVQKSIVLKVATGLNSDVKTVGLKS